MKEMFGIDPLWHLTEAVSLQEAASLIAGYDPHEIALIIEDSDVLEAYPKYYPVIRALRQAVSSKTLEACKTEWVFGYDEDTDYEYNTGILIAEETMVRVDDLKVWLSESNCKFNFFFLSTTPDYLDQSHKNYSPKLAAAINVWEAVTSNSSLMHKTTAKTAMKKWLRMNASKYGLTKDDGKPNEQGIEEVAKVANWDSKGGAPKTGS